MLFKEGNDSFAQMVQTTHPISHALRVIRSNHAAPKELLECMEQLNVSLVLYNGEFREHLETRSHLRVSVDADEETTFAVDETYHPLRFQISRM